MERRKKAALCLLGAGAATTIAMMMFRGLLAYVPFVTAAFSIGSVFLWVTTNTSSGDR